MWSRDLLKQNAKQSLSRNTLATLLVILAYSVLTGGLVQFVFSSQAKEVDWNLVAEMLPLFLLVAGGTSLVTGLYNIFVKNPLDVGLNRYFMEARMGTPPFGSLFGGFRSGDYGHITFTMFMTNLKIWLYSLLLVVPGIIKSYSYLLVPYLLAENPQMDRHRAQQLSQTMMYGEKWNVFVLELSFMGWIFLNAILCGLAAIIFMPLSIVVAIILQLALNAYIQATLAEFYAAMREKAFARAYTTPAELGGFIAY